MSSIQVTSIKLRSLSHFSSSMTMPFLQSRISSLSFSLISSMLSSEGRKRSKSSMFQNLKSFSFLIPSNSGCWIASSMVILFLGSNTKVFSRKSSHYGLQQSNISLGFFLLYFGNDLMQLVASASSMNETSSSVGLPMTCSILDLCQIHGYIWSSSLQGNPFLRVQSLASSCLGGDKGKQAFPANRAFLGQVTIIFLFFSCSETSQPRIQPTAHISIDESYLVCMRISSGARYHRLTTWQVMSLLDLSWLSMVKSPQSTPGLASPKSQILILKLLSLRMFSGLRSRCRTFMLLRYLSAMSNWQMILGTCSSLRNRFLRKSFLRSNSWYSRTTPRLSQLSISGGGSISQILMILSWFIFRRIITSRRVLNARTRLVNIFLYFFTAQIFFVYLCRTWYTSPYEPDPSI